jgi:CRISPR-associated protein Cas8b/Csh1 subtype I-B
MSSKLDQSTLGELLPRGPISSLRRVQTLYGAIAEAAGEKGGDPAYSIYFTPGELTEFVAAGDDTDRYLVTVEVDLTSRPASEENIDVSVEPMTTDHVRQIGFARYPWGRGIDHSITRRGAKGGSDAEQAATYCIDCLERWTNADGREPAVGRVADDHPDGWIITELQRLGQDDAVQTVLEDSLARRLSGAPRVTATVRLKLDPTAMAEPPTSATGTPEWFYPGHVDVLNAGMKARKEQKLAKKNLSKSDDPSRGRATCMVTGEESEVFGTTDDPLAFYTVQHAEKFPELDKQESWRAHSVSSDAALLVQSGSSLVESCRTTRNSLGVYTLPYFTETTDKRAELLYRALVRLQERDERTSDQHPMAFIEETVASGGTAADRSALRFYTISLKNNSGDINVFYEEPNVDLYWPRLVGKEYESVLQKTPSFDETAGFGLTESWRLLSSETDADGFLNAIVSGSFAWNTVPRPDGDDGAMVDDDVEWYTYQLLTGSPIPVSKLLRLFVDRLEAEREADPENRLSTNHLKMQLAQLDALARADLLVADEDHERLTIPPTAMTTDEIDLSHLRTEEGTIPRPAVRRYRLEQFLQSREAFENQERRGAFLMGVLVGQLSHHQRDTRQMNRTLQDQHPAEHMTGGKLSKLYPTLTDKARIYATEVEWAPDILFPETIDELTETVPSPPPTEWSLSRQDLQFFYALGVGYGTRAESRVFDLLDKHDAQNDQTATPDAE